MGPCFVLWLRVRFSLGIQGVAPFPSCRGWRNELNRNYVDICCTKFWLVVADAITAADP
ncbi:hypothetical protein SAMN04488056_101369 [Cohaesibacter marisflavi]|uniref:Uncharacterized protein n=1 Tax=Cohaesibacter marisflavi TaxID=655353 RepID=A0A1I5A744_9HYPH|nr:hypothetical protein SAMN04488056_101369 [Cohaesibacter marisflavi]